MMSDFLMWEQEVRGEIKLISDILREKLSDEPEALIKDLQVAEAYNARCGSMLAAANSWLDQGKKYLLPSREGRTELDRKIEMDSKVAGIRLVRDELESLCNSIKQRLILGESILSYNKQFAERVPKEPSRPWG